MCLRLKRLQWFLCEHGMDEETAEKVYLALDELPDKVLETLDWEICEEMHYKGYDIFKLEKTNKPSDYQKRLFQNDF
jgi:hypothetical protein